MHTSPIILAATTLFAGISTADYLQQTLSGDSPSIFFQVTNFEAAYDSDTEKTEVSFTVEGITSDLQIAFPASSCSASVDGASPDGLMQQVDITNCSRPDGSVALSFGLLNYGYAGESRLLGIIHVARDNGFGNFVYETANYIIGPKDITTRRKNGKKYQVIAGPGISKGFTVPAATNG